MNFVKFPIEALDSLNPENFLSFSDVIDGDNPAVRSKVQEIIDGIEDGVERAVALFKWVRDSIKYTMYAPFMYRRDYSASTILRRGEGYCVQKAVLLTTFYRVAGFPAGLIFADIVNHRAPPVAVEFMGTNLFTYHGYVALYLREKWYKVTPAFDIETCRKAGYPVVEFDGSGDAVFPPVDSRGERFIEYVKIHGVYSDLPLDELLDAWRRVYGEGRVKLWEKAYQEFFN